MQTGHFTQLVPKIRAAERAGDLDEAVGLLLHALRAVEAEAAGGGPVAPWYYERLAIIYKGLKHHDKEIAVLERYMDTFAGKVDPPFPHLVKRLEKARSAAANKARKE